MIGASGDAASNLPEPPDAAARQRALDTGTSFLVQAPAGSGKTELLIRRFAALLETVKEPEEIVAITFTIKAAAEMRARVLQRLANEPGLDRWQLAQNPGRLRIQTIDALCASLARQIPLASGFGAPLATVEDAGALYREAARRALAHVETSGPAADHVARLLEHLDNNLARAEDLLAAMLARRDHWLRHVQRGLSREALERALRRERQAVITRLRALWPQEEDDWPALADRLLTKTEGTWRKNLKGVHDGNEPLRLALLEVRTLLPERYDDAQWDALEAISRLLPLAAAELRLVFRARGQVDFSEVSAAALFALGDDDAPTDLALALDYRIRHLLVDEFQDTSITQYELIARLTAGWEPGDGRTVFAVGDPMQSIYRFREAEVGEFLRTADAGQLGSVQVECLRLTANFRSDASIVDWVNASFARVFPGEEDIAGGAVPYAPSVPVHPSAAGDAVAVLGFFDRDAEADRVRELVAGLRRDEPDASVALLVRDRGALAAIVPGLRRAGLRFRAIEIDALGERPVVVDLRALTRAISHPADRIAWLAVLRAPWCGLTLRELAAIAEGRRDRSIPELLREARGERLERVRGILDRALEQRLRTSLREAVERAWLELGGPACVDETALEDADIYLDALEASEEAGSIVDAAAFDERLEKLWALPDVQAHPNDLQIMTIHKAKGLEFDHVIVAGLGRAPRNDEKRLFLWLERASEEGPELLLAPIEEAGGDDDPIYRWVRRLEADRNANELTRLLYVAATRARKRLTLLGEVGLRDSMPRKGSLLATLWPAVGGEIRITASPARETSAPQSGACLMRLSDDWRLPAPPDPVRPITVPDDAAAGAPIEFSWAGETARHVGTVVHRWLQRIAEDGLRGWDVARIGALEPRVLSALVMLGVSEAERPEAARRVVSALQRSIADERGRWVLGTHRSSAAEHRIVAIIDGTATRLVIDRYFETADGERWVVDYKTSSHAGAGVEAFLDRERERYAGQLTRYVRAMELDGRGPVRAGLYFPLLGGWREVERA